MRPAGQALDADDRDVATMRLHQDLIGLRRRHPWLHAARTEVLELANRQLAYESTADGERLRVLLNLDDEPWTYDGVTVGPHGWAVPGELDG